MTRDQRKTPHDEQAAPAPARPGRFLRWLRRPQAILALALGYLGLAYLAVLLFDVFSLWGVQDRIGRFSGQPLVWWWIFQEKGLTEVLQWTLLLAGAVTGAILSGRLHTAGERAASRFWLLIAVLLAILAVEDASSWRYVLVAWTTAVATGIAGGDYGHPVRLFTEAFYYAAIAAIPIYAVARYWRVMWDTPSRWWFVSGFVAYAVAAMASVSRYIGFWYMHTGDWIDARLGGRLYDGYQLRHARDPGAGNWFMDLLVEESIELVAAALLLASVLAYARWHDAKRAGASDERDAGRPDADGPDAD